MGSRKWIAVVAMVGAALAAAPVSADGQGRSPFWVAIERDDLRVVNALLSACADERMPGPADAAKLTAWLEACQDVGVGARRWNDGLTALEAAAGAGSAEVVRGLVASGADVEEATPEGGGALWIASKQGHAEVVLALLAAGADVNVQSAWGQTALDYALERDDQETIKALQAAGAKRGG